MNKIPKAKYEELFSEKDKVQAFDKIAEIYYNQNFGSISKQDIDLLMFSIYIEQILDKTEADISTYSDYTLSKVLGITQSKIRNLKERKELKYPYEKFDWKKSFERVSRNATYENGKIKIELHDKNLYNEIKNFIEEKGGYVKAQFDKKKIIKLGNSVYVYKFLIPSKFTLSSINFCLFNSIHLIPTFFTHQIKNLILNIQRFI